MELNNKQKNKVTSEKDHFSMIPHYITDHSFSNALALYVQIKRHAGEDGKCFATEQTLMKKLGIGKKAFDKALKYLLSKNFIVFIGKTPSKTRPINSYGSVDIWKMNTGFYKKINTESNISIKDTFQKHTDKSQKLHKISSQSNAEEEPYLRRTQKEEAQNSLEVKEIKSEISKLVKKLKLESNQNNNSP